MQFLDDMEVEQKDEFDYDKGTLAGLNISSGAG